MTDGEFGLLLHHFFPSIQNQKKIAVAVSGGGDSLALLHLLSRWSALNHGLEIMALTVDHGLRPESKDEAKQVAGWVKNWPHVTHHILTWRGPKPKTRISETARAKRYELLHEFCKKNQVAHLFLAHQQDDQAETVLMRLAAGSGVDGLAGMHTIQSYKDIFLLRPLLNIAHERLAVTLQAAKQKWIEDPTNQNENYLRPRLRAARDVLEAEGLSAKRLSVLSTRMARVHDALEYMTNEYWAQATLTKEQVTFILTLWTTLPDEIRIRLMIRAIAHVGRKAARLEQVEVLAQKLSGESTRTMRVTLAGTVITRGAKTIKIVRENRSRS